MQRWVLGEEEQSWVGAARQTPLLSGQGQWEDQHHQPHWGEPAPLPCRQQCCSRGKPVCQDVRWVIRDLQGWAHSASLFLPFYSNEGALVGKGAVQATGKHQGTLEGMSKCRSNPACIKCLSRLLQGWWGADRTGRQQSYCRATTNTSKSSGKAESPWACAMLQLQAAGEPS